MIRPIAVVLTGSVLLVCQKKCYGFISSRGFLAASPCHHSRSHHERPRRGPQHHYGHRTVLHWASRSATRPITTLGASSGFGSSTHDSGAYFPDDDSGLVDGDGGAEGANVGGRPGSEQQQQFPDVSAWTLGKEPKGIGTLFEKEDEVIRELSSDEYVDIVREWAPLASFAANEAPDPKMKEGAQRILNALKGMAEWEPRRSGDYIKEGSKWAFGAPVGAIKGGQVCFTLLDYERHSGHGGVDAMACLQVSENGGVVIEWICDNPIALGIPGNAVDWLARGVEALCGKRLDLPVSMSGRAMGMEGTRAADGGNSSSEKGATGNGGNKGKSKKRT